MIGCDIAGPAEKNTICCLYKLKSFSTERWSWKAAKHLLSIVYHPWLVLLIQAFLINTWRYVSKVSMHHTTPHEKQAPPFSPNSPSSKRSYYRLVCGIRWCSLSLSTTRMMQVLLSFCLATLDPTFSATVDCCSGTNIKSAHKKDCTAHTMKLQHVKGPTFQRLLPNEHAVSTSEHDESSLVASHLHHYHHQNHGYHHRYHHHNNNNNDDDHHHHPQSL